MRNMACAVWRMMTGMRAYFICCMNVPTRINCRTSRCLRIRTCTHTRIRTRNVSRFGHSFSIHNRLSGCTRIRGRTRSIIIRMRRRTRSCLTIASREYYD